MKEELKIIELTEENIESMIYEIRGQKVMLDFDLARIYGYETKRFNEQVKNNIEKFPDDFMFRLTREEMEQLVMSKKSTLNKSVTESEEFARSKKSTARIWTIGNKGGRTNLPYVFTEQGVYMLMTVLKGELAVKQSIALIRLFKRMKDFIEDNKGLIDYDASIINNKFLSYDKKFEEVDEKLRIVMGNFIDPSTYKRFLILNGQKIEADIAYQTIYSLAKHTIHIVDDYIDVKTLHLLLSANENIKITIVSDNVSRNPLQEEFIEEFKQQSKADLIIKPSNNRCHDRFIIIDYSMDNECIYICGSSSKDAGKKITTIIKADDVNISEQIASLL